jgi:hypothetical protein
MRFVHVVGAIVWVGGQLTLALVVTPALRAAVAGPAQVAAMRDIGRRFAAVANLIVLPLQLSTGLALAWHRGVVLSSFSAPGYGRALGVKLILVAAAVAAVAGGTEQGPAPEVGELLEVRGPVDAGHVVEHRAQQVVLGDVGVEAADHLGDLRPGVEVPGRYRALRVAHGCSSGRMTRLTFSSIR